LRTGANALVSAGITTAIGGGSFTKNLGAAAVGGAVDLGASVGNQAVGDFADDVARSLNVTTAEATKLILHSLLGGLISKAEGGDFAAGAVAGGVAEGLTPVANKLLATYVSDRFDVSDLSDAGSQAKISTAQIIG
jgi:filamentous hemagglutinin